MTRGFRGLAIGACLVILAGTAGRGTPAEVERGARVATTADGVASALRDDGDLVTLRQAIAQSLRWLARQPPERTQWLGPRTLTVAEQTRALRRMLELLADDPSPDVLDERVRAEFDLLRSAGGSDGAMLVTGYHEPIVEAAESPSAEYRVPILGVPRDLYARRRGPYWSRAQIEQGRLGKLARPLAWARDPVDAFFLEIEGSGTLRLPGGRELRVGPAATNGRAYRSIGQLLVEEGHLAREAVTMRALREWLTARPAERARVFAHNESYVFFALRHGAPVGSLGVPLTAGRSVATDPRVFPRGGLAFLRTRRPIESVGGQISWVPLDRFVLAQDAGGAIRGPGRVDVFWGRGPGAELAASDMKEPGELYWLVPKATREASRE